jgi:hypothetical protein
VYFCAGFPSWFSDVRLSSFQLLMLGGTLLFVAGLLLGLRRSARVTLQRSLLTDEIIAYLGRIADALERNTPPSKEEIVAKVERRMAERAEPKLSVKAHTIPYSMFGREYSENK